MTVVKAKFNAIFSMGLFLFACLSATVMLMYSISRSAEWLLVKFSLAVVVLLIALLIAGRMIRMNRKMILEKGKITINQVLLGKKISVPVKNIKAWKLEEVSMKGGNFRELTVLIDDKTFVKFSNREHEQFEKAVSYLQKNVAKKQTR